MRTFFPLFFCLCFGLSFPTITFCNLWVPQNSTTNNCLQDVHFTDENTGWAVGCNGTIQHTTNGGDTWVAQMSDQNELLGSVYAIDNLTAWILGSNGSIQHTTDGGVTWMTQVSGTATPLIDVFFIDANTGWAVGNMGVILHTTDGGATWTSQVSGVSGTPANGLNSVFFIDANTGWIAASGETILHTTDGGMTWTIQLSGTPGDNFSSIHFIDANTGWAAGGHLLYHTTDGGMNWTVQNFLPPTLIIDVFFIDANTGWAVGLNGMTSDGLIFHTTDGGITWTQQASFTSTPFIAVHFIDNDTAWVVGNDGIIFTYCGNIVPVELTYFKGTTTTNGNLIQWGTASELNNQGFEVQRSPDGKNWKSLDFILGEGTTVTTQAYDFLDKIPLDNKNYYRLKQLNTDGTFDYSSIIELSQNSKHINQLNAFPNPTVGHFFYELPSIESVKQIQLFDAYGNLVLTTTQIDGTLSIEHLSSGTYCLVAETEISQVSLVIIKQ